VTRYDTIGRGYTAHRRADPRIAGAIHRALGDASSVVNVGAGAGAYEPPQTTLAIEPSQVMIEQRPAASAPALQAYAEALPLTDDVADAALAVLTVHHWSDLAAGLAELRRVARRRIVIFTWRPERLATYWLSDYVPSGSGLDGRPAMSVEAIVALLPGTQITVNPVPIPHDCADGFAAAYWRRPHAYLDAGVRAGISTLAMAEAAVLRRGLDRLAGDLDSGRWHAEHADLLDLDEFDVGYVTITAEW
jgi:SAM-dependent methyltransferase